jgi:hypothetical protein
VDRLIVPATKDNIFRINKVKRKELFCLSGNLENPLLLEGSKFIDRVYWILLSPLVRNIVRTWLAGLWSSPRSVIATMHHRSRVYTIEHFWSYGGSGLIKHVPRNPVIILD